MSTSIINQANPHTGPHAKAVNICKNPILKHPRIIIRPILPIRRRAGNEPRPILPIKYHYQSLIRPSLQRQALLAAHLIYRAASEKQATILGLPALITADQRNRPVTQNDTLQWKTLPRLQLVPRTSLVLTTTAQWNRRALNPPACRICQSAVIHLKASFTKFQGKRSDPRLRHLNTGTPLCSVVTLSNSLFNLLLCTHPHMNHTHTMAPARQHCCDTIAEATSLWTRS